MQFVERLASSDDVDVKNLIGISIIDYDIEERFASIMGPNSQTAEFCIMLGKMTKIIL